MTFSGPPTLADDEATLQRYAELLADTFERVSAQWFRELVESRSAGLVAQPGVGEHLDAMAAETVTALRRLLGMDIAEQPTNPLELLRHATQGPTQVLADAGVAPVARDDFDVANFPLDVYALVPLSFDEIDEALREPGIAWGAAKAHVHLRRRREAPPTPVPPSSPASRSASAATTEAPAARVVVLSADLMDRSKISAVYPEAIVVRSIDKLLEEAATATLALVDLNRVPDPSVLGGIEAPVVAFGSHVDTDKLAVAEAAGATALARSAFFHRLSE